MNNVIYTDDLRKIMRKPVYVDNDSPDYEKGWRDACVGFEACIKKAEEEARMHEKEKECQLWRIKENALGVRNDYDEKFNPTVDFDTVRAGDVPLGGVFLRSVNGSFQALVKCGFDLINNEVNYFFLDEWNKPMKFYFLMPDTREVIYTGWIFPEKFMSPKELWND